MQDLLRQIKEGMTLERVFERMQTTDFDLAVLHLLRAITASFWTMKLSMVSSLMALRCTGEQSVLKLAMQASSRVLAWHGLMHNHIACRLVFCPICMSLSPAYAGCNKSIAEYCDNGLVGFWLWGLKGFAVNCPSQVCVLHHNINPKKAMSILFEFCIHQNLLSMLSVSLAAVTLRCLRLCGKETVPMYKEAEDLRVAALTSVFPVRVVLHIVAGNHGNHGEAHDVVYGPMMLRVI